MRISLKFVRQDLKIIIVSNKIKLTALTLVNVRELYNRT